MSRPRKPGITGGMLSAEPKICEHGNTYNCLPCEVKHLHYVIEELIEQNEQLKHRIPREIEDDLRRKVERYKKALIECVYQRGLVPFLEQNEWAISEDYFVQLAKEALEVTT